MVDKVLSKNVSRVSSFGCIEFGNGVLLVWGKDVPVSVHENLPIVEMERATQTLHHPLDDTRIENQLHIEGSHKSMQCRHGSNKFALVCSAIQPVVAAYAHVHRVFGARLFSVPCQGTFADIEQKLVNGIVGFNVALCKARNLSKAGIFSNAYDAAGDTCAHGECVLGTGH